MILINMTTTLLEVELELQDQVPPRTTRPICPSIWGNDTMNLSKVLLEGRMINRKTSELTTTLKMVARPKLKRKLLSTLEIKDKYDLKGVNDPDRIKNKVKSRNKGRKMYSAIKVKCRNDERMRYPHPPRRFRWVKNRNKKDERMFPSSMLFQKYLPPPLFSFDGADDRLRNMITLKTFRNRGMR